MNTEGTQKPRILKYTILLQNLKLICTVTRLLGTLTTYLGGTVDTNARETFQYIATSW